MKRGWTLIELMVVIIVIGVIMLIVLPRFGEIRDRSREGTTKGSLGALRSAINNYYADKEGIWPSILSDPSFEGVYIDEIPRARLRGGIRGNNDTNSVTYGTTPQPPYGGWLYDSNTGRLRINHIEVDTRGIPYSSY